MAKHVLSPLACSALILGLTACASGSSDGATDRVTVTASTSPAAISTYADRRQAKFHADGADGMVATAGALWVKTDLGHVLRVDPSSNRVTADVVVDPHTGQSFYCQGIGASAGAIWSCATRKDGTQIARIDPAAARITSIVRVGKVFDQLALPSAARGVWVLTRGGNSVSVIDPASGRVSTYPLDARCQQLAASGNRVVATSVVEDRVVVLDQRSGALLKTLEVPVPRMAVIAGPDIWVDSSDGLTRFSGDLVTRTVYPGMTAGQGGDLYYGAGSVWLRGSDGTISRIDADSGTVRERIVPSSPLSGGSLVVAYGSIWTTGSEEGQVIRLHQ